MGNPITNFSNNCKGKKQPKKAKFRDANPAWKGGATYVHKRGNYIGAKYVKCPVGFESMQIKTGYVLEHRLFVAQQIGRCLEKTEVVHHIDHNPKNNDLSNLMLFSSQSDHKKFEGGKMFIRPIWCLNDCN